MDVTQFPGLGPLLDPLALAIVGGGTALAVVLRTPFRDLGRGVSALRVLGRRSFDVEPLLAQVAALGRISKRHGVLALDRTVIADPDVEAGIQAVVDGASPAEVRSLLGHRFAARLDRHRAGWDMWSGAAEAAPAMGMIGTLVGLVQLFTAMRDPAAIGGAMAVALLTTLYGAALANLVAMPIAARLKRHARHEYQARARLADPIAALAHVDAAVPRQMRDHAA